MTGQTRKVTQNTVQRAWCGDCKSPDVHVRRDGTFGEHRVWLGGSTSSFLCDGSGRKVGSIRSNAA